MKRSASEPGLTRFILHFSSNGTAQLADTLHKELQGAVSITVEPNSLNKSINFSTATT